MREIIKNTLIFFGVLGCVFLTAFELRKVVEGPILTVDSPYDGMVVSTSSIVVSGTADNIAFIYLNGRQIFIDENGHFDERIGLFEGYNVIELEAKDRFSSGKTQQYRVIFIKPS
jgi:hypothetical protein